MHTVRVPRVDESVHPDEPPAAAAERLARAKAASGSREGHLSLGCDTLVVHGERILGKPETPRQAIRMLSGLADAEHTVYTGIALATPERVESSVEATRVWFRGLSPREVSEYVATGEPLDKAGAYGIQSYGAAIVDRIAGDYFNVMGLPVQRLLELFGRFGLRYAFGRLVPAEDGASQSSAADA